MGQTTTVGQPGSGDWTRHPAVRALAVLALLYVFLVGVNGLGDGFKSLSSGVLEDFFEATENPFFALMVGILATTLMQSSSVTTSLIVALVAAPDNPLPIANAIPMVMGANIGTTVTNTIVALAHMGRKTEFRRAFAVATCHDFFNYMAVVVLLPLELWTGYLRKTAESLTSLFTGFGGAKYDSPIKGAVKAGVRPIKDLLAAVTGGGGGGDGAGGGHLEAILLIAVSGLLIFLALGFLVRVMRSTMQARVEGAVGRALGRSVLIGMAVGIVVTVMVQSSSITTSLLVPLAGAGLLTLEQAFPITIGANIGTTVTAFLAAMAVTGANASAGITIALVHLLFNLSGTLLIYPIKRIRELPLMAARRLSYAAMESRKLALVYVVVLFYGIPTLFAVLNRVLRK